jgi:DNA-binding PadR family transcriptional regulator
MPRDTLGEFEHMVLLCILRLGGEAYSVPVTLELEARSGREVAQSAVFIAMKRMEEKGLLESRMDDGSVKETGRVRRYFKLTPAAAAKLRETREALERLWEGTEAQLDRI